MFKMLRTYRLGRAVMKTIENLVGNAEKNILHHHSMLFCGKWQDSVAEWSKALV